MIAIIFTADFEQLVEWRDVRVIVIAQSARIVIVDVLQPRGPLHRLEELVDLLLVFDDGEFDLRVLEDEQHLLRDRVLV